MIEKLKLRNFRNFENYEICFEKNINLIIWENWKWKTNILEAISLLSNNPLQEIWFENLIKSDKNNMFISGNFKNNLVWVSFEKENINYIDNNPVRKNSWKKKFLVNSKSILRKNLNKFSSKTIIFSPVTMNLFYLSPNLRRKFLDNIIENSFDDYKIYYKKFENILKQRNKLLKAIKEKKEKIESLNFWDWELIKSIIIIYKYRKNLINFIKKDIWNLEKYFLNKNVKISFEYESKINLQNPLLTKQNFSEIIKKELENYLKKNLDLEIILWRTTIWPHLDDFNIKVDNYKIIDFASRWEIKSVILGLKFIEINYLEKNTKEIPIILIDDFLSELDGNHQKLLLSKLSWFQTIVTAISDNFSLEENTIKKIFLK